MLESGGTYDIGSNNRAAGQGNDNACVQAITPTKLVLAGLSK